MQHLSLGYQILDGAGDIFNRHLRVDPVLVHEIDTVGTQTLQHALDSKLDVVRATVEPWAALARLQIDVPAELRCDHHLVAKRTHAFAEDALHLMRAVSLGRIVKGEATVEGRPDDADHLGTSWDHGLIGAAHVLDTKANAGDFQRSKLPPSAQWSCCRPARVCLLS